MDWLPTGLLSSLFAIVVIDLVLAGWLSKKKTAPAS